MLNVFGIWFLFNVAPGLNAHAQAFVDLFPLLLILRVSFGIKGGF